jgi:hypothetical protein
MRVGGITPGAKAGANRFVLPVKNAEASASIPRGTPVVLDLSTTADAAGDGLEVVLPSTAGNVISYGAKFGVLTDTLAAGATGESILFGISTYTLITRATRAASTDSWTSSASQASGAVMAGIDTLNNAFLTAASSAASLASALPAGLLLDSIASFAATASSTADTRTVLTSAVRAFIRMM